jgi:hypothetical protein
LEDTKARNADSFALFQVLCNHADEIAEEGCTSPFRQMMFLGQGRSKMLEGNGTVGFGRSNWFVCFT